MKKVLFLMSLLFLSYTVQAQDLLKLKGEEKEKSSSSALKNLSIGFAIGLAPNLANLGESIMDDGVLELDSGTLASNTNTGYLIMSDKDNAIGLDSTDGTNTSTLQFITSFQEGGALIGANLNLNAQYDFNELLGLPLFARIGFEYVFQFMGGSMSRTLGSGVDNYVTAQISKGVVFPSPAGGYAGGTLETNFSCSWLEIPVTVGFMTTIHNRAKIYGGVGIGYIRGGWSLNMKGDDKYVRYLTAFDGEADSLASGAIDETVNFVLATYAFNFVLGFEFFFTDKIVSYFEWAASGNAGTVYAEARFSERGSNIMTAALGGSAAYSMDSQYIKKFAYPVSLGGSRFKFGARYYIF
ncbi:MAG: hypothetical protein GY754_25435 [bacterium]|nr:hypothetical protein [bacterium]